LRLNVAESQLVDWLARLRAAAGSHAADIPAPPELPAPRAALKRPEAFAAPSFDLTIRWLPATTAVVPSLVDFGFGAIYAVVGTVLVYRRF
jgi:hypothetical protein